MSGVFLSYSRVDRALADQVTQALRAVGVDVWWDEDMGGVDWQEELERKIEALAAVVVLWSEASSSSKSVRDEARLALAADKLVNALAGLKQPPFPFDRVNGLPLDGWVPGQPHRGWERLVQTLEAHVVAAGGVAPGQFTGALARQEEERQRRIQTVTRLAEAVHEAMAREEDAREAANLAKVGFDREQEQFQRFVDLRPGQRVLGAAQAELDIVRSAWEQAEEAHQASLFQLREAERVLAAAERDLAAPSFRPASAPRPQPEAAAAVAAPAKAAAKARAESRPAKPAPPPSEPKPVASVEPKVVKPKPIAAEPRAPLEQPGPSFVAQPPAASASVPSWLTPSRIAVAASLAAVLVAGGLIGSRLSAGKAVSAASAAQTGVASASPSAGDPSTAPPPVDRHAVALVGNWAMPGFSCDQPVTISVKADTITLAMPGQTSAARIDPGSKANLIRAHGDDGDWSYRLNDPNLLQVSAPGGLALKMTRCAG
jgi:hypothetical protein